MDERVHVLSNDASAWTDGLRNRLGAELRVASSAEDMEAGRALLQFLSDYVINQGAVIRAGETIEYGYGIVKCVSGDDGYLELWEYLPDNDDYAPGAHRTMTIAREQREVCNAAGAPFTNVRLSHAAAVSPGVHEGDDLEGVRYSALDEIPGWYIFTDRYNGDVRQMKVEHLWHVTKSRPEIVPYLALPVGYRFRIASGQVHVWFDSEAFEHNE